MSSKPPSAEEQGDLLFRLFLDMMLRSDTHTKIGMIIILFNITLTRSIDPSKWKKIKDNNLLNDNVQLINTLCLNLICNQDITDDQIGLIEDEIQKVVIAL